MYYITCYLGNITVRDMGNILRYYLGNIWTLFYKAIPGNLVSWKKVLPPLGGGGGGGGVELQYQERSLTATMGITGKELN